MFNGKWELVDSFEGINEDDYEVEEVVQFLTLDLAHHATLLTTAESIQITDLTSVHPIVRIGNCDTFIGTHNETIGTDILLLNNNDPVALSTHKLTLSPITLLTHQVAQKAREEAAAKEIKRRKKADGRRKLQESKAKAAAMQGGVEKLNLDATPQEKVVKKRKSMGVVAPDEEPEASSSGTV